MDTKRCVYCHKLSPVEATSCIHCSRPFARTTGASRKLDSGGWPTVKRSHPSRSRRPSIPPASPHHAGLHPEDQPYQSSVMSIQRPPKPKTEPLNGAVQTSRHSSQQETEKMRLAAAATEPAPAIVSQVDYVKLPVTPLPEADISDLATLPRIPRKPFFRGRSVPTMLTAACLLLLVATSILAYIFISKKPELPAPLLTATPGQLRVNDTFILAGNNFEARDVVSFTRDVNIVMRDSNGAPLKARTDDTGNFSVQITVQPDWSLGQHLIHATDEAQQLSVSTAITVQQAPPTSPSLQLINTSVNFGAGPRGKSSSQNIILTNAGGGQLTWQASSDQPWLTVTPNSGTFSGKALVVLTVNRGALTSQTYSGNVKFIQQGSTSSPLIVHVTMSVQAVTASLIV